MGEVFRARDTRLGREVAVKILPAPAADDRERVRRFELEARAASALNHPGILTVHDVGTEEGRPYIVTELLEGEVLRDLLSRGPLAIDRALDLAIQIAGALAAAHDKGIVHRDLKPENLFVLRDGRVKVLDFGLARLLRAERVLDLSSEVPTATRTEPGAVLGTLGYMSPEQVRGAPTDERTDIFALGVNLYEMLTGRKAFGAPTAADTLSAILKEDPPPLTGLRPDVPDEAARVVARCLAKRAEDRFPSARELASALREVTATASREQTPERAPRPSALATLRRNSRTVVVSLVSLAAVVLALIVSWRSGGPRGSPASIDSLAVLPLENLSGDETQDYLAEGMTESLITRLAQIRALKVISRTSVMRYRGERGPLPAIARELGVDAIVEGSVLQFGDRVRIAAQLIHGSTDTHLWAREYDGDLSDVLTLQAQVAQAIAREIAVQVRPEEAKRLTASSRVEPELYQLVLRGRYHWNQRSEEGLVKAVELFREATRRGPGYAPAYAGLADAYLSQFDYGLISWEDSTGKARAAATKALELDDGLAAAHTSLAHILLHEWEWQAAEREFRRAIELDPSYTVAHHWHALCLTALGRVEDAVHAMKRAHELDPLSIRINADLGMAYLAAGRYEEAVAQEDRTLELAPGAATPRWIRGMALEQLGRFDEAEADMKAVLETAPGDASIMGSLGHVFAAAGKRTEARRLLSELIAQSEKGEVAFFVALIHAGLNEREEALTWLERAVEERSGSVRYLKIEPRLEGLRDEPRYRALIDQAGLPR